MQMQEPEQQQWQAEQEYSQYQATYSDSGEVDQQQAYEAGLAASDYQDQKIYPQARQRSKVPPVLGIIFASIGFFVTLAGIIISALALQFSNGRHLWPVGGGVGLAASILLMLVSIAIWVLSLVMLLLRSRRTHSRKSFRGFYF